MWINTNFTGGIFFYKWLLVAYLPGRFERSLDVEEENYLVSDMNVDYLIQQLMNLIILAHK